MNLVIDAGNTSTKIAIFNHDELLFNEAVIELGEAYLRQLRSQFHFQNAIISSVKGMMNEEKEWLQQNCNYVNFSHATKIPISIDYQCVETLGLDRIAAAVGSWAMFPQQSSLSILLGTCMVSNFVDESGCFCGGSIAPGIRMRLQAMHQFTERLPLIDALTEVDFVGKSTHDSMMSGAIYGLLSEIDGIVTFYQSKYKNNNIAVTGGDFPFLSKSIKSSIFAIPNLVLFGLNEIIKINV